MTRAKKVDANQSEIVAEFRRLGWEVIDTHALGCGFPDVIVAREEYRGQTYMESLYYWKCKLVEIKNGNAPYSPAEKEFMAKYPGLVTTVRSIEDVKELFG